MQYITQAGTDTGRQEARQAQTQQEARTQEKQIQEATGRKNQACQIGDAR